MLICCRFSPELKEGALAWITLFPRYLVCEEVGGATQKTHYHAAFDSDIGVEAIKKRFQTQCKALGLVSKKGQENAYYGGVKPCDENFFEYVAKDYTGDQNRVWSSMTHPMIEIYASAGKTKYTVPIVTKNDVKIEYVHVLPKKASTMRAKFIEFLVSENWSKNESIGLHNYQQKCDDIIDALTDFWENAFTTPQGAVMVEHAKWVFADDDIRDIIKLNNRHAITKCLR